MEDEDVHMSTSTTLPPQGQNHDRDDAMMGSMAELPTGPTSGATDQAVPPHDNPWTSSTATSTHEDAMDTNPDETPHARPPSIIPPPTMSSPTAARPATPIPNVQATEHAPYIDETLVRLNSRGESVDSRGDSPELLRVPPPARLHGSSSSRPQSPRPDLSDEREDSSEEDDSGPAWHEIHEDTSVPNETELREMKAMGQQASALNREST